MYNMLVVATPGAGYILGSGQAINIPGLCLTCAGTMMVAASNQVFEVENDAKMKRTMLRPLPSGCITVPHAVTWATIAGASGIVLIINLVQICWQLDLQLLTSSCMHLCRLHSSKFIQSIHGLELLLVLSLHFWGGQISLNAMILPAALYFWQIPHFMALAYMCRNDYAAGGSNELTLLLSLQQQFDRRLLKHLSS